MDKFLSPQQELFLSSYTNPKSETFGNALQSALKAGYTQSYAENITVYMPDWLMENLGDMKMIRKAEKNLNEFLEMDTEGDSNKLRIKQDTSKFVVERLNKKKYSTRSELTGADGKDLPTPILTDVSKNNSNEQDSKLNEEN